MTSAVRRLTHGQDLRHCLTAVMQESQFSAATVCSLVGSLAHVRLRAAGGDSVLEFSGPFEIVSATGTLAPSAMHVHIAVSDSRGTTFGGHLLEGCLVATTVEVVIQEVSDWAFSRQLDATTGYNELTAVKLDV